ncbi:MAG: nucleotide exchange factor GrpE [Ignavibacteria bacterium RBG_16_34_14]|nr:MAG: nucleotide exchange factor GrpE [Ignavibacteria bacterium RBG_16_34_14]
MDSDENKKMNMNDKQPRDEEINKNEKEESASENLLNEEAARKDLRIAQLEKEIENLKDKFLRKAAEFENYKRRTENDQLNLIKYSAVSFILKLLPVMDDFERSLDHIEEAKDIDALKAGLKLVYEKLSKALADEGVKKIDSVSKPFNVNFHEAVMQRKDDSVEPHTVLDEIEKGYLYKDKVIRHSKVIVSEESTEESIEDNKSNLNKDDEESGK